MSNLAAAQHLLGLSEAYLNNLSNEHLIRVHWGGTQLTDELILRVRKTYNVPAIVHIANSSKQAGGSTKPALTSEQVTADVAAALDRRQQLTERRDGLHGALPLPLLAGMPRPKRATKRIDTPTDVLDLGGGKLLSASHRGKTPDGWTSLIVVLKFRHTLKFRNGVVGLDKKYEYENTRKRPAKDLTAEGGLCAKRLRTSARQIYREASRDED